MYGVFVNFTYPIQHIMHAVAFYTILLLNIDLNCVMSKSDKMAYINFYTHTLAHICNGYRACNWNTKPCKQSITCTQNLPHWIHLNHFNWPNFIRTIIGSHCNRTTKGLSQFIFRIVIFTSINLFASLFICFLLVFAPQDIRTRQKCHCYVLM